MTRLARLRANALQRLIRTPQSWAEAFADWLQGLRPPRSAASPKAALADAAAEYRKMAFTFIVIALSAKLAKCGGGLTREEFIAFREAFPLEDVESAKLRALFHLAWQDGAEAEAFARQAVYLYPDRPDLWAELLRYLCGVAQADGPLNVQELRMLSELAAVFGYTRSQLGRLIASCGGAKAPDPRRVLGLSRHATPEEVKARYYALMRHYHPDTLAGRVHYPEARAAAERKSAAIADAYRVLRKRA